MQQDKHDKSAREVAMDFNFSFQLNSISNESSKLEIETIYDLLVLGAGPAGLNAALYGVRKGLKVGVLGSRKGGQAVDTSYVDNVLGMPGMTGEGLMRQFWEHVEDNGVPIQEEAEIVTYQPEGKLHEVVLATGDTYRSKSLVIATGATPRRLGIPGESDFFGKGVAYCAICDGPLFKGKDVFVVGGGNSAVESALDLAKVVNTVTIVHRSKFRADKVLTDQLASKSNIKVCLDTQIREILGSDFMTGILVEDTRTSQQRILEGQGVFVEIGLVPSTKPFLKHLHTNEQGEIITTIRGETNLPGVFAAGDVTDVPYKQIITAMGAGATAALAANDYINQLS